MTLSLADIQAKVDEIKGEAGDDERQHVLEDRLHELVLMAIATKLCDDPPAAAHLAMSTNGIKFSRWYS